MKKSVLLKASAGEAPVKKLLYLRQHDLLSIKVLNLNYEVN